MGGASEVTIVEGPALTDGTRGRSFEQSELLAPFLTELIIRNSGQSLDS